MPRPPRIDLPGVPQHIVIRGNNRSDLFRAENDWRVFLRYLRHAADGTGSQVHAFALMTNHVHLLASGTASGRLSSLVQSVGRRYAYYVNRVYERTGTLFEGRFHSSLVDSETYLFTCMRYIELNPVRAGIVTDPGDYPWTSYRQNAGTEPFGWLTPRDEYRALGPDHAARGEAYRALFSRPFDAADLAAIRECARKGCALGSREFVARTEQALGRPARIRPRGRPRKREAAEKVSDPF
jgi:putative transposase